VYITWWLSTAIKLAGENFVFVMVNLDDIVPRLNTETFRNLAEGARSIKPTGKRWWEQDWDDLQRFTTKLASLEGGKGCMAEEDTKLPIEVSKIIGGGGSDQQVQEETTSTADELARGMTGLTCTDPQKVETTPTKVAAVELPSSKATMAEEDTKLPIEATVSKPSLTIPGQILYVDVFNGELHPVVGDIRELREVLRPKNYTQEAIDHHALSAYMNSLRSLRMRMFGLMPKHESSVPCIRDEDANCSVCGSCPTWPYICKQSDAAKAVVSHTCTYCSKVCCVICAPAGDKIPNDPTNNNSMKTVQDLRISLPSIGRIDPQRVCVVCYLNAYIL
jgi:hypothetical protein